MDYPREHDIFRSVSLTTTDWLGFDWDWFGFGNYPAPWWNLWFVIDGAGAGPWRFWWYGRWDTDFD